VTEPPAWDVRALLRLLAVAALCALAVFFASLIAPLVRLDPLVAFAISFACVTAEILALSWFAPGLRWKQAWVLVTLAVLPLLILYFFAAPVAGWSAALLTLALGAGAALLGAALGSRIEQPGQLAAVALVSAIADLWSVFDPGAPSARFAEQALAEPGKLALFALPFPLFGTPLVPPIIGAGDIVFTALYLAAFRAHGLSAKRLTLALLVAYGLALIGLVVLLRPLPLLPLLGAAVLACEPAARSLTRREWRTVAAVSLALLVAVALLRSR
jgi:hypothetical protein